MSQRVTLEDVARQSGVSLATVSLVLRDKPGINDETRQRVLDVAWTLGYRRREQVGFTPTQTLQRVGLLNNIRADDQPESQHFYTPVIAGIEAACRRQRISLLYATVPVDEQSHLPELPRMLLEKNLDGLFLVGAFVDSTIARLTERRTIPLVLVDAYAIEHGYDSVISDNFQGAYAAASYLIAQGHRRIGLIGSLPTAYPSIRERRRGYLQALHDCGITQQFFGDSRTSADEAAEAAADLLRSFPEVTALFCCTDVVALAAIQAAQALGRRVPDDLSVIGFDNIDLAKHVIPALTTMHIDKVHMGRLAVQLLINRTEFPAANAMTTILRPTLVERQSVRPVVVPTEANAF